LYRLCGGYQSQRDFYQHQIKQLDATHGLKFSSHDLNVLPAITLTQPGYQIIDNADRDWMDNPFNTSLADYEKKLVELLPNTPNDLDQELLDLAGNRLDEQPRTSSRAKRVLSDEDFNLDTKDSFNVKRFKREPKIQSPPQSDHDIKPFLTDVLADLKPSIDYSSNEDFPDPNQLLKEIESKRTKQQDGKYTEERESSPPDPDFELYCRCGAKGHGDYEENVQATIECDMCHRFSHVACLKGLVPKTGILTRFECDFCSLAPHIKALRMDR
jgi:hypothetical protein